MASGQAKVAAADAIELAPRAGVRMLVVAGMDGFSESCFDPNWWLAQECARPAGAGRGANWFVDAADGTWVLRHYRRGGMVARVLDDRYLWTGYARSRSFREFRLLQQLTGRGLAVPRPVAARVVRRGLTYRADLLTEMLPRTVTLASRIGDGRIDADDLAAAGRQIRRMHERGVWHADLNAHNILLDDDGQAFLIDFDRARLRDGERWKAANLARLRRSLDKLTLPPGGFDEDRWQTLLGAYRDAENEPSQ